MDLKKTVPFFIVFIIFTAALFLFQSVLLQFGLYRNVLLTANTLFCLLGIVTLLIQQKALQNSNPNVFIRSVMGVMMIKMFVGILAVLAYALSVPGYSTASIFAGMFLYFVYLIIEVNVLLKLNSQKNA